MSDSGASAGVCPDRRATNYANGERTSVRAYLYAYICAFLLMMRLHFRVYVMVCAFSSVCVRVVEWQCMPPKMMCVCESERTQHDEYAHAHANTSFKVHVCAVSCLSRFPQSWTHAFLIIVFFYIDLLHCRWSPYALNCFIEGIFFYAMFFYTELLKFRRCSCTLNCVISNSVVLH